MADIGERLIADTPGSPSPSAARTPTAFRIRYLEAGQGPRWCTCMAPAAIRPEGHTRPRLPPEQLARRLYAHPERQPLLHLDPEVLAKQEALVARLRGPSRDADLEGRLAAVEIPTPVLFGTLDRMIPPEMGRLYREKLDNSHFVLVYEAAHAIGADRPEAFTSLVSDFLERHAQFVVNRTRGLLHP